MKTIDFLASKAAFRQALDSAEAVGFVVELDFEPVEAAAQGRFGSVASKAEQYFHYHHQPLEYKAVVADFAEPGSVVAVVELADSPRLAVIAEVGFGFAEAVGFVELVAQCLDFAVDSSKVVAEFAVVVG